MSGAVSVQQPFLKSFSGKKIRKVLPHVLSGDSEFKVVAELKVFSEIQAARFCGGRWRFGRCPERGVIDLLDLNVIRQLEAVSTLLA
jgi:hypothetical protein